jgi:heat shock protein HslJ
MRNFVYIIFSVVLFIGLSCSKDDDDKVVAQKLEGTWVLNGISTINSSLSMNIPANNKPMLSFIGSNLVNVTAPCNSGQGTWQVSNSKVLITNLAMTEMACDYLDLEFIYVNNLSGIYTVDNLALHIESDNGYDLYFDKAAESD